MNLFFGRPHALDFEFLLRQMPDAEFGNLTRSTVPLLAFWSDPGRVAGALARLGIEPNPADKLCFEYPVKSLGRNRASFTDVMYLSEQVALGVEGKSTEPMYETVAEWLTSRGVSENRRDVLDHWLGLIHGPGRQFDREAVGGAVYQMLHRVASICSVAASRNVLLYQIFGRDRADLSRKEGEYSARLEHLARAVDATGRVEVWLQTLLLNPTEAYRKTQLRLDRSDRKLRPAIVREALLRGGMFAFSGDDTNLSRFS